MKSNETVKGTEIPELKNNTNMKLLKELKQKKEIIKWEALDINKQELTFGTHRLTYLTLLHIGWHSWCY